MIVSLEIPDSIANDLKARKGDLSVCALQSLALEGYRSGELSAYQVRLMLGHASRWETEEFLRQHQAWQEYGMNELEHDRQTLNSVLP
ncbi:MAG: hypothetical protein JWO95_2653 [Verrucomicrobiales bacterium]|nr:hypothetical protein [Verrucomicrobiales bacterium]